MQIVLISATIFNSYTVKSTLMNFKITLLCKLYSDTNTFNKAEEILEQEPLKKQTCPPIQMAPQKPAAEAKNWKKKPLARLLKVDLSQGCSVIFPPLPHTHTHTHDKRLSFRHICAFHSLICVSNTQLWMRTGSCRSGRARSSNKPARRRVDASC